MPWQLWLCFGSRGVGYNYEEALLAAQTPAPERSSVVWKRIFENYSGYSFPELLSLQAEKLVATWNDGRFEGAIYALWPNSSPKWTYRLTQPGYRLAHISELSSQVYLLMLYLLTAVVTWTELRVKRWNPAVFFCLLSIFGTMIYLQFFETAARRVLLIMPLMLLQICCVLPRLSKTHDLIGTET